MSIEISNKLTNQISQELTQRLYDFYIFQANKIDGEDIPGFSKHQQINKFVLFQIYQEWKAQRRRLSHSFFNFEAPEVQSSLDHFMDNLSQNIRIHKNDFKPLVEKAVFNTLKLITDPVTTLSRFFFLNSQEIKMETFEKHSHYFVDFSPFVKAILKHYQSQESKIINKEDFIFKLEKIIQIFEQKNNTQLINYQSGLLQSTFELSLEELNDRENEFNVPEIPPIPNIPPLKPQIPLEDITPPAPIEIPVPPIAKKEPEAAPIEIIPPVIPPVEPPKQEFIPAGIPINPVSEIPSEEELRTTIGTINPPIEDVPEVPLQKKIEFSTRPIEPLEKDQNPIDLFGKKEEIEVEEPKPKTLAESFHNQPENLHEKINQTGISLDSIPVHKQFQFVQKLFGGSTVKFKVVMGRIGEANNKQEAMDIANKYIFNSPTVNPEDKISQEFLELLTS